MLIILAVAIAAAAALSQDTYYSIFSYRYSIPKVGINDRSIALQANLYPKFYNERSARRDMQWVAQNDSALTAFWHQQGDTVLHALRELSGIEWYEAEFDIYLVRYFPSIGSSDPVIIPVGGISDGTVIEAAPDGHRLILDLVFQLARRMLAQAVQPEDSIHLGIAYHPLMRPGAYRLDNLAMLLALNTCLSIVGLDSTYGAYSSAFWIRHMPGRKIFENYLQDQWILTPERTLADWLAQEPYSSELVRVTHPPRLVRQDTGRQHRKSVAGLPLRGKLGFSMTIDESNRLVVDQIDIYRLAYACGLREGDRIYRVESRRPKTQKDFIEKLLQAMDNGGATVEVIREGQTMMVLIQPMETQGPDEDYSPYDFEIMDSVSFDTTDFDQIE